MVLGGLQAFSLVSILLLILPGLAGTKLYLRGVSRQDRFGRLDTVVIGIVGSLLGLLLVYLWYWFYLGTLTTDELYGAAPLWRELESHVDTLPEQVSRYLVLFGLVTGVGYLLGQRAILLSQLPDAPNKSWRLLFEGSRAGGEDGGNVFVEIETKSGKQIAGEVDEWSVDSRSLIPREAEWDSSGGLRQRRLSGSRVYIHEEEVARVHVDDPGGEADGADGENTEPDDKTEDLVESADEGDSNE
jgi:uncharacterized membrane protein YeaQ/YmgE (transglycosylase-associated protein family)